MAKLLEFDIALMGYDNTQAAGFYLPVNVYEIFGKKGLVKVKATFDGYLYRGTLQPQGDGRHALIVRKDIQKSIGKRAGDTIHVTIEEDTEERLVTVPTDFLSLLEQNPPAKALFETLAYTHRKEYVRWIEEAKRQETREKRLAKAIELLNAGKKIS